MVQIALCLFLAFLSSAIGNHLKLSHNVSSMQIRIAEYLPKNEVAVKHVYLILCDHIDLDIVYGESYNFSLTIFNERFLRWKTGLFNQNENDFVFVIRQRKRSSRSRVTAHWLKIADLKSARNGDITNILRPSKIFPSAKQTIYVSFRDMVPYSFLDRGRMNGLDWKIVSTLAKRNNLSIAFLTCFEDEPDWKLGLKCSEER